MLLEKRILTLRNTAPKALYNDLRVRFNDDTHSAAHLGNEEVAEPSLKALMKVDLGLLEENRVTPFGGKTLNDNREDLANAAAYFNKVVAVYQSFKVQIATTFEAKGVGDVEVREPGCHTVGECGCSPGRSPIGDCLRGVSLEETQAVLATRFLCGGSCRDTIAQVLRAGAQCSASRWRGRKLEHSQASEEEERIGRWERELFRGGQGNAYGPATACRAGEGLCRRI